jgi:ATP-dependent Zn protease
MKDSESSRRIPFGALTLVTYVAGLAVTLLIVMPQRDAEHVPYSDFGQMVRAGRIADVVIDEHRIRGTMKDDGRRFETMRIDDPRLVDDLEQHGVKFFGGAAEYSWVDLAGWIVPLFVLDVLTRQLMEREAVEGPEIRALIAKAAPNAPRAA